MASFNRDRHGGVGVIAAAVSHMLKRGVASLINTSTHEGKMGAGQAIEHGRRANAVYASIANINEARVLRICYFRMRAARKHEITPYCERNGCFLLL